MPGDINRELLMKKRAGGTYKHTGTESMSAIPTNFYKTKKKFRKKHLQMDDMVALNHLISCEM